MSGDAWKEGGIDATGMSTTVCTVRLVFAVQFSGALLMQIWIMHTKNNGFQPPYLTLRKSFLKCH
jgi:hypothetical protein